jgi:hypothetical protein
MSIGWWAKVKADPLLRERERARAVSAQKKYYGTVGGRIAIYKSNAKRGGVPFELPDALCADLITDRCYYCGLEAGPYNGIDRVDNASGYHEGNVVTACAQCNLSKNDWTKTEFEAWIYRAADHLRRVGA